MRFIFLALILLAFPILEIWLLVEAGDRYGWWLFGYLVVIAILGWRLIMDEKLMIFSRMAQTLGEGGTPMKALMGTAKNVIAGILFIIPGLISDAIALVLLVLPSHSSVQGKSARRASSKAANDDVIEGEYRRED